MAAGRCRNKLLLLNGCSQTGGAPLVGLLSLKAGVRGMLAGREWRKAEGVSERAMAELREVAPRSLPESYFSLLTFSNGGEGPLPVQPLWLCLYRAEEVVRIARQGTFEEFFSGLFVIGGNGAGEAVAFDLRAAAPHSLVSFDMTNTDLAESVCLIAPSFDAALELIGRSEE